MKPNLAISSNLMIDDDIHKPLHRYIPGDYVGQIYRELADNRVAGRELTPRQLIEQRQYLLCLLCRRSCAGTCGARRR